MSVRDIVRGAGDILAQRYGQKTGYSVKERHHLLSEVDVELDQFIVSRLRQQFPGDAVFSEESASQAGTSSRRWIVDPIDGTANFITGVPYFAISVALEEDGQVIEGHVYNPVSDEYFYSSVELGRSLLNDEPIAASQTTVIDDAIVALGFSANMKVINEYHRHWREVFDRCRKGLGWIAPALSICNVARGRLEAFIDTGCSMQGQAAASLILRNAGGSMFDMGFAAYDYRTKGAIFCCRPIVEGLRECYAA